MSPISGKDLCFVVTGMLILVGGYVQFMYEQISHPRRLVQHSEYRNLHLALQHATKLTRLHANKMEDCAPVVAPQHGFKASRVLVLGSGGLVGTALTNMLKHTNYQVVEVLNRYDLDLRRKGALDTLLQTQEIDFCFFLACEVGGSKFLNDPNMQALSYYYSDLMQEGVIESLRSRNISFLFASSQLVHGDTLYGHVKSKGEDLALASTGKVFRLWNAYGVEPVGFKSHVIADWVHECLKTGKVMSMTDGWESRQFMHVDDLASTLIRLMQIFDTIPSVVDLAPDSSWTMRDMASMISSNIPGGCNFIFSTTPSYSSVLPKQLIKVPGSLNCGIKRVVDSYSQATKNKKTYLSIIIACTNDDYNGIRARLFGFLHYLGEQLRRTDLRYELILVQYNPSLPDYYSPEYNQDVARSQDLPISLLLPLTRGITSLSPLRILTIPRHHHQFAETGAFWEYIAKNAGAQIAQGEFLLFTNPDNVFPSKLVAWLAQGQLLKNRVYRTGRLSVDFIDQTRCDKVGTGHGACAKKGFCAAGTEGGGLNSYCDVCLGDFSIFHRDLFYETRGYLEYPQALHVESGHLEYARTLPVYQGVEEHWLDESICHRDHEHTDNQKKFSLEIADIARIMGERPASSEWGYSSTVQGFPQANLSGDFWDWGYNPETPFLMRRHHPLFAELFPSASLDMAPFTREYHVDFAGTRTKYEYDCENWDRYRRFHLSRRLPCDRIDVFAKFDLGAGNFDMPVYGDPPIIEEEYFEWLSLLRALRAWTQEETTRPFVIAEFGARYGTWAARGGVMARKLKPSQGCAIVAVEGDSICFGWLQDHIKANQLEKNATLVRGMVGGQHGSTQAINWESGSSSDTVLVYTVPELLHSYALVDIVHIDIQNSEVALVLDEVHAFLTQRVKFLHIGTHSPEILESIKGKFQVDWEVLQAFHSPQVVETEMGPIKLVWDGEIALRNRRWP